MKLVPKQIHSKKLSPKERAYWAGYFDGFRDSAIYTERRLFPPEEYKSERPSVTVERNGRRVTIFGEKGERGGTNHAA